MDSLRIEDLRPGDVLRLTCRHCGELLELPAARCLTLAQPFKLVSDFAHDHICGACRKLGADVELLPAEPTDVSEP